MRRSSLRRLLTASLAIALISISTPLLAGTINHTVRSGDTLWDLAAKYHTSVAAIAQANGMSEKSVLRTGKTLVIPTKTSRVNQVVRQSVRTIHTNADSVCLRSGPSTSYSKIAILPKGSTAKVLFTKGSWTKVALGCGTCGYIYSKLLGDGEGTITYTKSSPVTKCSTYNPSSSNNSSLVQTAMSLRGCKYRTGGTSRGGFDCSGFTRYVFAKYGVSLPHNSKAQASVGKPISKSQLAPGDLVFFHTYRSGISHVGIYIGDNKFVHAARYGRGVRVDSLGSSYYAPRYRGARRVK